MEIRGIFLLTILCLASSVRRSGTENVTDTAGDRDDRDWRNNDERTSRKHDSVLRRGIDEDNNGCSRYCIQRKRISTLDEGIVDSIKRVNIIWKIVNDSRVTFDGESSWGMSASRDKELRLEPSRITLENGARFKDHEARCEIYLQLGCEDRGKTNDSAYDILDEHLNRELKNLAALDAAEGYTETAFDVDNFTEELRILALGKLSQAILEIPIARRGHFTNERGPRPTLSLSRTSDAKGVRLDARNPPSGGWRLKLLGVENSNYSLSVVATSDENLPENSSSKRNAKFPTTPPKGKTVREVETMGSSGSNEIAVTVEPSRTNESLSVAKFARQANIEAEVMEPEEMSKIVAGRSSGEAVVDERAKIVENSELEELARGVDDGRTGTRRTVVDVHPSTELIARPGTLHVVVFTVTNNQALGIRHAFQGRSTRFRVIGVSPTVLWIQPGQEVNVAVQIAVPNTQDPVPSTVTLYVEGSENFEVVEKSTYVYVEGPGVTTADTAKPSIDYSFNDNCAGKLARDRCSRTRWSVEITVKDSDSGLKRVTSLPEGVEPRSQFIAGTKNSVNFYYISSCCYTTVDVTAIDVQGNTYKRTIDVTEWDNLSQGEIAAVVVGALLILLLIILVVLIVVYCIRKRKSHDLSYSQRYGSRTPASAERTDF